MGLLSCFKTAFERCYHRPHRVEHPVNRHPSRHHRTALDLNKKRESIAQDLLDAKREAQSKALAKEQELKPLHTIPVIQVDRDSDDYCLPQALLVPSEPEEQEPQLYEVPLKSPDAADYVHLEDTEQGKHPYSVDSPTLGRKHYGAIPPNDSSDSLIPHTGGSNPQLPQEPLELRRRKRHATVDKPMPAQLARIILESKPPVPTPRKAIIKMDHKVDLLATSAFVLKYAGTNCFHTDRLPLTKMVQYNLLMKEEIDRCSAYLTEEPAWKALPPEAIGHAKNILMERKFKFMREIEAELIIAPRPTQVVLVANGYNPMAVALAEKFPSVMFYVTDRSQQACQWNAEVYRKLELNNLMVVHSDCMRENLIAAIQRTCAEDYSVQDDRGRLFKTDDATIFALEGISYYLTQEGENELLKTCLEMDSYRNIVLMDYKDEFAFDHWQDIKELQNNPEPYYHRLVTQAVREITGCDPQRTTTMVDVETSLYKVFTDKSPRVLQVEDCEMTEADRAKLSQIEKDYDKDRSRGVLTGGGMLKIVTRPRFFGFYHPVDQQAPLVTETRLKPLPIPLTHDLALQVKHKPEGIIYKPEIPQEVPLSMLTGVQHDSLTTKL